MHRFARTAGLLGLAVLAASGIHVTGAAAAPAAPTASYTGVYQRMAVHDPGDGHAHAHAPGDTGVRDMLVVGKRPMRLSLPRGRKLTPGATVRVRGTVSGGTLSAMETTTTAEPVAVAPSTSTAATQTRVLVILASWTAPDAVTQQSATAQLFSDGDAWRKEVSNGSHGFTGTVTPWLTITGPTGGLCLTNHAETMSQARAAALLAGYDAAAYDRVALYHPKSDNPDCSGYSGWAYQPGTEIWLNGAMNRRTVMHELGHNDGLWHAGSMTCTVNGAYVAIAATGCTTSAYGDITDAMGGSSYAGHFSGTQKSRLGWLGARAVTLGVGSSTVLAPAAQTGSSVIAATIAGANGRRYWLETRGATGADASLPAGVLGGLLVRVDDPALGSLPLLLDLTPDGSHGNAALPAGGSWTAPEGFVISTVPTAGGLAVSVGTDTVAPAAPRSVTVAVKGTTATITWANPTDADFEGVVVQMKAGTAAPTSVTDGTRVYTGTGTTATAAGLARGVTYSFAVFARDEVPNWSAGASPVARTRK